jgi:tetratricopeptide (TPR) repeat protein
MAARVDYAKLYNPYDFSNPVTNRDLFVGRQKELDDLRYYLDQAAKAPRPINIAALGPRASGKTSLLNMIELEARGREFCVARVDLNESDVESPMGFFFKIFDTVLNAACGCSRPGDESLCFEGKGGKTYDVYLDMISTYRVPAEKEWCPFVFPIQYAKAMESGMQTCRVSEASFKDDLKRIHGEVARPVAILFDECNVLSKNRVLLEMLRNIFMNTAGYMLVFTGTPDLFPVMDEVFSPIVRQFKKVEIGRFEDIEETKECIRKPLESIGITDSSDIFDFDDPTQLKEIHDFVGGRPYEIQLLCHFLFRRVQTGQAPRMRLDLVVLDDVLRELGGGRDLSAHPLTAKIRSFDRGRLRALARLTQCSGNATFEQIWFAGYVFAAAPGKQRASLSARLEEFSKDGIVHIKDGIITFKGDEFDRIYSKYFARQEGIDLLFPEVGYEQFFLIYMAAACKLQFKLEFLGEMTHSALLPPTYAQDAGQAMRELPNIGSLRRLFDTYPIDLSVGIYWTLLERSRKKQETVSLVTVVAKTQWLNVQLPFLLDSGTDDESQTEELTKGLEAMAVRARALGGEVHWQIDKNKAIPPVEVFASAVVESANERLKKALSHRHALHMRHVYLHKHDRQSALSHAALSQQYGATSEDMNNIGYVYMASGDYHRAEEALRLTVEGNGGKVRGLGEFNLGVVELMLGHPKVARSWLTKALEVWKEAPPEDAIIACLFVPTSTQGGLTLEERLNPNPLEIVKETLAAASIL